MARIRSIHPGLFTDEAFASLSMGARVLLLGIWTEADDHGVFEWKPVTLKMRVMPVDNVSIPELLAECERADVIKRFSSGKSYGLVRNFCRFQKPKKPNYTHPIPSEFYTYAGLNPDGSLPVTHRSGIGTEKPQQREEGGDSSEDGKEMGEGAKPAPAKPSSGVGEGQGGTLLTLDFVPTPETRKTIAEMGFGDEQYNNELSKFHAYYPARGLRRADWNAQLLSWFMRATPDQKPANPPMGVIKNKFFVVRGTLAWTCWTQHILETTGRPWSRTLEWRDESGRVQEGWWWPSEYPPGYNDFGEKVPAQSAEDAA
ncbi:hypothetical protein ACSVBT_06980 [Afipia sp. TerB]